jgi:hypothetical protein
MKNSNFKATIGLAACFLAVPALKAAMIVNMNGCLARGESAHEYTMTDNSGERYGLLPERGINVRKHVGQEVMVTGDVIKAKKERREASKNGNPLDDQYLRVYQIKRMSQSCQ